ncbi:cytochrome P450, partial [Amylocystis lapponica]
MLSLFTWAMFIVIFSVVVSYTRILRRVKTLPPGPPADPVIGHLRILPTSRQEKVFQQWAAEYGDVLYLNAAGLPIVILSNFEVAIDLLEKRSSIYSDRPKCTMYELQGWYPAVSIMQYGPLWRKHRRLIHERFSPEEVPAYRDLQTREAHILLKNLLYQPTENSWHVRRFSTAIIMDLVYGQRVVSNDDEFINFAKYTTEALESGPAGSSLLDFFPALQYVPQWVPGMPWVFEAVHAHRSKVRMMHDLPFELVRRDMTAGVAKPSFVSTHLEGLYRSNCDTADELEDIKGVAYTVFVGGAETTWATIMVFILAMIRVPEAQRKAQEEIDRVIGSGRMPDFSDRASLPYVECVLEETLRFHPVVPLGLPHRTMEDDIYNGMFIPKGSTVLANIYAMSRDENVYKHPDTFFPERFLPHPVGYGEAQLKASFGFGRRICPGRHLASASVWIAIATILATLNLTEATGDDGAKITPELTFLDGLSSAPVPFDCAIVPRSPEAEMLIKLAHV